MRDIRHEKLSSLVHRRASEVILYELKDPRLGFVTVTRVKLSKDLRHATVYWSVVGPDSDRTKTAHALDHARGFVQSEVAAALQTRVTPALDFEYDESVEGSVRVSRILDELRRRRGEDTTLLPDGEEE
ncbi:MAG: 30S ribosome-binding factor RbfA [Planctomycetes bacterium]|jgi:ribosome-binding factor A|nr:30S ribosome-binding factor RbfA [Planctomycetota bacterium]